MSKKVFIFLFEIVFWMPLFSQPKEKKITLNEVIRIAKEQSPDAILAKHKFRTSYWQFRSYKANYLPSINLTSNLLNFNRSIEWNDYTQNIIDKNSLTEFGQLSLDQNIGLTGGTISLSSSLNEIRQLGSDSANYLSKPVSINFSQPLFGFNRFKWERKIQPLVYEEARKSYLDAVEQVALKAIGRFFDLALAQLNLKIARINFNNSDTLYKIAKGRYNLGTIAENDVLQMQLSFLNSKTEVAKAEMDVEIQKQRIRSFLGYNEKVDFDLILPDSIPALELEYLNVLNLASKNNPDVIARHRQIIEADRDVAQAKGQRRSIILGASYGINHAMTNNIPDVYRNPYLDREQANISLQIPIADWGLGRGKVKMAQSQQELVNIQVQQAQTDFEQNIFLQVMQFNLQNNQVKIATMSDTIGQKRYDITKQRFLIGKIDVLNLNDALKEKDSAKRQYISALRDYWNYFYTIRQLTLFDFVNNKELDEDYDNLVK